MSRYPSERKEAVLRKMLAPHNTTIKELSQEEAISDADLVQLAQTGPC